MMQSAPAMPSRKAQSRVLALAPPPALLLLAPPAPRRGPLRRALARIVQAIRRIEPMFPPMSCC